MALLRDIRKGASHPLGGWAAGGAVVFWTMVGVSVGLGLAMLLNLSSSATSLIVGLAAVLGVGLGFYAGLGATTLARVLALPGVILEYLQ